MPAPRPPSPTVEYRRLRRDEADEACALARAVFDASVAGGQPQAGRTLFHRFARPEALLARHRTRYTTWVAVAGPRIVGVLHLHARNHVSLLFVAPDRQRSGVATTLLHTAAAAGEFVPPATVNSSPAAVPYYARLGFRPDGPPVFKDGIHHQPMTLAGPLPPCRGTG